MRRFVQEPLAHFVLIGAALFAFQHFVKGSGASDAAHIEVTRERIATLRVESERTWGRPLSDVELASVVQDYVRDEALYREGLALGLERDDSVIRNRVKQRMEYLLEEAIPEVEPSDAELAKLIDEYPERYLVAERLSFEHVFIAVGSDGRQSMERALALRAELEGGRARSSDAGDACLLPRRWVGATLEEVTLRFGDTVADELRTSPRGTWSAPVASPLGLHLVRMLERTPAERASLPVVRAIARSDWQRARREEAKRAAVEALRAHYRVTIDLPGIQPEPAQALAEPKP
jgi:parvulin-like peptidyl-prolyl isomerase